MERAPFDPASTRVENIAYQHLAQDAFDRHGVVPTYVVDYPVANTPASVAILKGSLRLRAMRDRRASASLGQPPGGRGDFHVPLLRLQPARRADARVSWRCSADAIARSFGRRRRFTRPAVRRRAGHAADPARPRLSADTSVVPHTDFAPMAGRISAGLPEQPFLTDGRTARGALSVDSRAGRRAPGRARMAGSSGPLLRMPGIAARLGAPGAAPPLARRGMRWTT